MRTCCHFALGASDAVLRAFLLIQRGDEMSVSYSIEPDLPAEAFREVLRTSGLAERRPADDLERLDRMLRQADIIAVARDGARIVGVARAITDFSYCCYLSDLAVDKAYKDRGIGRRLIEEIHATAGAQTSLVLIAAPAAEGYYPHIGLTRVASAWSRPRSG